MICGNCEGSGEVSHGCSRCAHRPPQYDCLACGNTGLVGPYPCDDCEGTGKVEDEDDE